MQISPPRKQARHLAHFKRKRISGHRSHPANESDSGAISPRKEKFPAIRN